jgi:cytochrome P450
MSNTEQRDDGSRPGCPMTGGFPFFSPGTQQDPYPLYARARAEAPVFFSAELGMWVATRHADVAAILRDPRRFSSRQTMQSLEAPPPEVVAVLRRGFPRAPTLINQDPPEHTRLRRLCNGAFTPERIAAREGPVREIAERLVDAFAAEGQADGVARFAYPLPKLVIADIVGVPREDIGKFGQWADDTGLMLHSAGLSTDARVRAAEGFVAFQHYIAAMIEPRRSQPGEDLVSTLIQAATDDAGKLDVPAVISGVAGFLIAGHKTTTDLIGNALALLLRHPAELAALARDPALAPAIVDETLRRDCPVPGTARVATEDAEVGGVTIPRGERILLLLGSANQDEALFENARDFALGRSALTEHLAFGRGVHYCIGAPLARLEARVALEVLTRRLRNLRLAGEEPVRFAQMTMFRGPVSLPLAWDV